MIRCFLAITFTFLTITTFSQFAVNTEAERIENGLSKYRWDPCICFHVYNSKGEIGVITRIAIGDKDVLKADSLDKEADKLGDTIASRLNSIGFKDLLLTLSYFDRNTDILGNTRLYHMIIDEGEVMGVGKNPAKPTPIAGMSFDYEQINMLKGLQLNRGQYIMHYCEEVGGRHLPRSTQAVSLVNIVNGTKRISSAESRKLYEKMRPLIKESGPYKIVVVRYKNQFRDKEVQDFLYSLDGKLMN